MAKKVIGRCRLCLLDDSELQESHFMPAAIYRSMLERGSKNPNPVLLTPLGAKQIDSQQKAHLLCRECEQRFSRCGEDWVFKHFLRADGTFPVADILKSRPPAVALPDGRTSIYWTADIPEIDRAALIYFASSMFWRAAIHPWKSDGTFPVRLGRRYEEEFRRFLMAEAHFPSEATLWILVRDGGDISKLSFSPAGGRVRDSDRNDNGFCYRFPIPGFAFVLAVGRNRLEVTKQFCMVRGDGNPIIWTSRLEEFIRQDGIDLVRRAQEVISAKSGRKKCKQG